MVDGFTGTHKFTIIGHNHVDDFQVFVIGGVQVLVGVKRGQPIIFGDVQPKSHFVLCDQQIINKVIYVGMNLFFI